ncbi:hypothetical protein Tco_0964194 [Tanacetum coccineum]
MVNFRSKEDDVARISTSVYISNIPDSINAKESLFLKALSPEILIVKNEGDECLGSKDLSLTLFGRVKEFASLANLKVAIGNEGFSEIVIKDKQSLWEFLHHEISKWRGEVIIMGDFNEVWSKSLLVGAILLGVLNRLRK